MTATVCSRSKHKYGIRDDKISLEFVSTKDVVNSDNCSDLFWYFRDCPDGTNAMFSFHELELDDPNSLAPNCDDVKSRIYMSYEDMYYVIIICQNDYDRFMKYFEFNVLHMIGHHLYMVANYMGKAIDPNRCQSEFDDNQPADDVRGFAYFIDRYASSPADVASNELVGITEEYLTEVYNQVYGQN